jgi:N6-L-threonylcarbamoyladenine synthase
MAAAMRVQAGVETPERNYTFDVKPRWALATCSRRSVS